ncbi:magnesium transporter MgtE N-terminal domain-containing protein [Candidatus Clostridium stratigraminis]|uniref:Magnesium transporter MgtE N-terminal domain-containing protein n=1 Tax=Candidatus Clostridium stratigraminis TaxID=3381661 RepID=A0ABW8T1U6_9CLOT
MVMNSFYLSRILGNKIYSSDHQVIGRIKDFAVNNDIKNPKVIGIKVKTGDGIRYLDWNNVSVTKEKGQYVLVCSSIKDIDVNNIMLLGHHVLDRQIIDVNGRKVVRVNDIRLANLSAGLFVVAVDIGTEGLLRRLGLAKPLKRVGLNVSSKLMLWNDVQTTFASNDIQLSKSYNKLSILHPSDLADIIEDFDSNTGMAIFSSFDNAKAADVLEEMEEKAQLNVLNNLSPDKAADILEEMPADEVADILDGLSEHKAEELLSNMEKEASDEVRELMEYENDVVGSLMSTDFISFNNKYTVENAINDLRRIKPEEDQMFYIYVVNDKNNLIGTISLRDLIVSEPSASLESIMNEDYIFMHDDDDIDDLIKNISKYNLVAIPVVDENMDLAGNVIISDIIYELLKNKRRVS